VLVRGVLAGAAGTGFMSCTEWLHVRAHRRGLLQSAASDAGRPVDFDVSGHVVTAAARVLRVEIRTARQAQALFLVTHFGYGSAFGVVGEVLRRAGLSRPARIVVFASIAEAWACTLFPLLGDTPPPWRWPTEALVASVVEHVIYAAVAVSVTDRLARSDEESEGPWPRAST
jgi:hypothetical protein